MASAESRLNDDGLTLDATLPSPSPSLADWLAKGAAGSRDRWLDPADQLLAGLDATLTDGRQVVIRPAPRRAVGPDLTALFVGAQGRTIFDPDFDIDDSGVPHEKPIIPGQ